MENLFNYLIAGMGIFFAFFIFGLAAIGVFTAFIAYIRYHVFGIHSPIIDDLFYRSAKGEATPPPNVVKGLTLIIVVIGGVYFFLH